MADRHESGVLDTRAYIDLALLDPVDPPKIPEITAATLAELHQGVAMAKEADVRAARTESLGAALVEFDSLPFDGDAAARYGSLVGLVMAASRASRPRRMDLMIAAIASSRGLLLYTRNAVDFKGLDGLLEVVDLH